MTISLIELNKNRPERAHLSSLLLFSFDCFYQICFQVISKEKVNQNNNRCFSAYGLLYVIDFISII